MNSQAQALADQAKDAFVAASVQWSAVQATKADASALILTIQGVAKQIAREGHLRRSQVQTLLTAEAKFAKVAEDFKVANDRHDAAARTFMERTLTLYMALTEKETAETAKVRALEAALTSEITSSHRIFLYQCVMVSAPALVALGLLAWRVIS